MKLAILVSVAALDIMLALGCGSSDSGSTPTATGGGAGSGGSAGAGPTGGSGGGAATGDYQGSCDSPSVGECVDNYCSGANCQTILNDEQPGCATDGGTWSQTNCAAAQCNCALTAMGWTKRTFYSQEDCAKVKTSCTAKGGTYGE